MNERDSLGAAARHRIRPGAGRAGHRRGAPHPGGGRQPGSTGSLALLLQLTGHEVHTAYDGVEALAAASALLRDVVLMDLGMPNLNGYDAASRIREQPWGKDMKLVAVTGWGQEEDRRRTAEAGFEGHVAKPVDYAAVVELLASLTASGRGEPAGAWGE